MARPRKYEAHKVEAYTIYATRKAAGEESTAVDIEVDLEGEHPEGTASSRLIVNWLKEFKNSDERQTLLDSPFEWHQMEASGLPWEASGFLMDILFVVESWRAERERAERSVPEVGSVIYTPTTVLSFRDALWCWRVHLAAPEIGDTVGDLSDVYHLARQFSLRQIASDVLGRPLSMADLEALLIFKPWLDSGKEETRHQAYHSAVAMGAIDGPPSPLAHATTLSNLIRAEARRRPEGDMGAFADTGFTGVGVFSQEHPELLVTQQWPMLLDKARIGGGRHETSRK